MREVLTELFPLWAAGRPAALATVVATHKSAPMPPGSAMLVTPDDQVAGSVSGGCVESDVYEVGKQVLCGAGPTRRRYGVSNDDAFAVGLTCGGEIDIFVEHIDRSTFPELGEVARAVREHRPVAVATVIGGPAGLRGSRMIVWADTVDGAIGSAQLDARIAEEARALLAAGYSALTSCSAGDPDSGELQIFINAMTPPPRLLVFGATDFAAALARIGAAAKYRVSVCDARTTFTTRDRFPGADDVIVEWPHRYLDNESAAGRLDARTAVTVLTHDPKFDVPVLTTALRMPQIGYIGVLGSRRTHADRIERLRSAGLTDRELTRMSSPLGLDIGASTPSETAISILAEIIAAKSGRPGGHLQTGTGPIHA
ncbi:MAG: XdhC family protein [Hyphomicrobiales bacterium]|nr:MAG: XdhC family protein [Hyphomicrobiales bacterium]